MRVIECNECGEPISAEDDKALASRLGKHLSKEHDEEMDADDLDETVADQAYDAVDS